jgi:uncharacterized protein YhbP (UPF0306 family)
MTDINAHARTVLDETTYAVLATADLDGTPWATPVWFAHDDLDCFYWLSWPGSRHSQLIDQRPEVAVTVFDTHAVPNQGTAFYATARARRCPDERLDEGLEILNRRSVAQGIGEFTRAHISGETRLRLYVAEVTDAWVLDPDAAVDQRAPVTR